MRRFLVAHRLQVVLGTGIEQLDQGIAMPFHGFRFPDAGRDPGHTDLHHRLIIFVLEVVRLANDHLDFAQLELRDGELVIYLLFSDRLCCVSTTRGELLGDFRPL